jgi:3-oxoacyl-[acyl-carrier protein] reductase
MKIDFTDKVVVVTGGSNGIGQAIAEMFLILNAKVYITGLLGQPEWCVKYTNYEYRTLDFHQESSVADFISEIESLVKIDVLVNNAGIQIIHSIGSINVEDWDKVLKVNLYGPMRMMNAVASKMIEKMQGKILNISSVAGLISKPGQSSYSASKSGLIGLTRSSALDLAPYNVLVNALCPGTTQTEMVESILNEEQKGAIIKNVPMKRFATVNEIANFAIFLCSDMNGFMTGQTIVVDGGFTAM